MTNLLPCRANGRPFWGVKTIERNIYIGWLCIMLGYSRKQVAAAFNLTPVRIQQILWQYRWFMKHAALPQFSLLPACVQPIVFVEEPK